MYTILLTDDETSVLETLATSISWQQFGVNKLLTATDGRQALEIIKEQQVDLLITDIRMPQMDGIELLQHVRSLNLSTHCILLTAYSEFEYARAAIKLGVENYLLKPFQKLELEATIEKAIDNLYTSRENSKHLFRNNILLRWVTGNITSEELGERSRLLNINIYLSEYCIVCMKKKVKNGTLATYCNACMNDLTKNYEVHQFWDNKGRYIFVIGGSKINRAELAEKLTSLAYETELNSIIALSIGGVVNDSDSLSKSYQEACELIEMADLSGEEILVIEQNDFLNREDDQLTRELDALFHQVEEISRKESYDKLSVKILEWREQQNVGYVLTKLGWSLFRIFSRQFPENPEFFYQIQTRMNLFTISLQEDFHSSIIELLEYSYLLFNYYFEQLSPVIQYAITYIHKNYSDNISIKDFCTKNKMNTAYLGYLFKKETGMFFNNYLTQYRIGCSMRFLKETDRTINEIAKLTGFSSPSYFITCFKKQTGMSPIKYRTQEPQENSSTLIY